jgi:hypothetical protein
MDDTLTAIVIGALGVGLVALIATAARREVRLIAALHAKLAKRGFAREPELPRVSPEGLALEPRFAWRGVLANGTAVVMVAGRGFGPSISKAAKITSTGHYFYVWAIVPASAQLDGAWLARWKGDARAVRQPDGAALVYWQRDYTPDGVPTALDEIETSLAA